MRLREILDRLFGIDSRSLAAFRIGIGALVLADLWTRSTALAQHYSDSGVLPREAYARLLSVSDWQWSIHLWAGSEGAQLFLFAVAAIAACSLIAGYRTRAATIVTWALLVSLQARNPMVLYGADQLLRLMLFWAMFLPLGATWSIDGRRGADPALRGSRHLSTASAALLLQPCVMYVFAGVLKWNASWRSGDALGHALSSEMYVTSFGRILAGWPGLVSAMSPAVPWIEMLAPVFLLMPWRTTTFRIVAVVLLVAFHVGMGCALRTGMFQAVVLVSLIPFLPVAFRDRPAIRYRSSASAHAASSPLGSRRRSTAAQTVVALLFVYSIAWNVAGLTIQEYSARHNLAWMQEWWSEGRTGVPLSFRDYAVERRMSRWGWIGRITGLHQRWDMFATAGPEMRGWPAITGTLDNGEEVSLLDGHRAALNQPQSGPEASPAFYAGTRWLVYFTYLRTSGTQSARELLPRVVTRDWERRNPGRSLVSLEVSFVHPGYGTPANIESWYDGPANGRVHGNQPFFGDKRPGFARDGEESSQGRENGTTSAAPDVAPPLD